MAAGEEDTAYEHLERVLRMMREGVTLLGLLCALARVDHVVWGAAGHTTG